MTEPSIDPRVLHGSWLRSPEEDTATEMVYRPVSYSFPPSRSREGIRLDPDGTVTHATSGATDLARHREGRWRLEGTVLHLEFDDARLRHVLQLVDASPDRLVARKLAR